MRALSYLAINLFIFVLSGCGTFLRTSEHHASNIDVHDGFVINSISQYSIAYMGNDDTSLVDNKKPPVMAVNQRDLLKIGVMRMPFSSGSLGVKLSEAQTPTEISITSNTGVSNAVEAASSAFDAANPSTESKK